MDLPRDQARFLAVFPPSRGCEYKKCVRVDNNPETPCSIQKRRKKDWPAWPEETPYILKLFWSPTQIAARTHPNVLALLRELKSWWHDEIDPEKSFVEPYAYADALRIRPGGIPFPGLGPHIDAGSLCRWAGPKYQDAYAKIWGGMPEQWDPYDLSVRKDANQAFFPGQTQSVVIRTFQGWTALTEAGAGEGSLLLYPDIRYTIAYVFLRPFFHPPAKGEDIFDPDTWTFDVEDSDGFEWCFPLCSRQRVPLQGTRK